MLLSMRTTHTPFLQKSIDRSENAKILTWDQGPIEQGFLCIDTYLDFEQM